MAGYGSYQNQNNSGTVLSLGCKWQAYRAPKVALTCGLLNDNEKVFGVQRIVLAFRDAGSSSRSEVGVKFPMTQRVQAARRPQGNKQAF